MSWSIGFIGKASNVVTALEDYSTKLEGQSKVEYDDVLPHMVGIVKQNFSNVEPVIKITANGHGYVENGVKKSGTCICTIENHYVTLV